MNSVVSSVERLCSGWCGSMIRCLRKGFRVWWFLVFIGCLLCSSMVIWWLCVVRLCSRWYWWVLLLLVVG